MLFKRPFSFFVCLPRLKCPFDPNLANEMAQKDDAHRRRRRRQPYRHPVVHV